MRRQLDLLSWQPPETVVAFPQQDVRAASITGMIARGIAASLKACSSSRDEIAEQMGAYLGRPVSKAVLDAYASQAREEHNISLPRFMALMHATKDRRLAEMLVQPFGWAVIERRHVPLVEVALLREREDALKRRRDALMRASRMKGTSPC